MSKPTVISERLKQGLLSQVTQRAETLSAWDDTFRAQLAQPLASHVRLANVRSETAVIQCDASVWAAKARFEIPNLLRILNRLQKDHHIRRIEIVVRPNTVPSKHETGSGKSFMSLSSSKLLASVAENTTDPNLRNVLNRLARHGRKP